MGKFFRITQGSVLIGAVFLLVAHVRDWQGLTVDSITIGLLAFIMAIPALDLIRRIKVGGFEAEIAPREIAKAVQKARSELPTPGKAHGRAQDRTDQLFELVREDPRLALAKLRMEIEGALKGLSKGVGGSERGTRFRPLSRQVEHLVSRSVLSPELGAAIRDVLPLANRAVHGETVRPRDAEELMEIGVRILEGLRWTLQERLTAPSETQVIASEKVDFYRKAHYRLTSIIPSVKKPQLVVRNLTQDELDDYLVNRPGFPGDPKV